MAITFSVSDTWIDLNESATTNVKSWLDGLNATTVYEITIKVISASKLYCVCVYA